MGYEWVHHDGYEQRQSMWYCNVGQLSNRSYWEKSTLKTESDLINLARLNFKIAKIYRNFHRANVLKYVLKYFIK